MEIIFKPESIKEAEGYYKTLHITAEQQKIINSMIPILNQHFSFPEKAIKGFLWRVLIPYQKKRHMGLDNSANLTPAERIKGLLEILGLLKEELTRVLVKPEQEPLLDEAFSKTMKFYKDNFANR